MSEQIDDSLEFRDERAGDDVRRKAELGWFEVEFTMYGTAYLKDNEMFYRISSEAEDIYTFIEISTHEDVYCGNVLSYTEKCLVPVGMKEDKALEVKKVLARKLRDLYPKELFYLLNDIAEQVKNDAAYPLLEEIREHIEGLFEQTLLMFFEEQVKYCYSCKKLSKKHYQEFLQWLEEEQKCMQDDFVEKDVLFKNFYGIAYANTDTNETYKYLEDSVLSYIYKYKSELEINGIFVSPIFSKTIYYNYTNKIVDVRKKYLADLKKVMNINYLTKLEKVTTTNQFFTIISDENEWLYSNENALETIKRYGGRWGINMVLSN